MASTTDLIHMKAADLLRDLAADKYAVLCLVDFINEIQTNQKDLDSCPVDSGQVVAALNRIANEKNRTATLVIMLRDYVALAIKNGMKGYA